MSIGGRAYEIASLVEIGEPGVYAIYYDAEKRKVGISVKKPQVDFDVYEDLFTAPVLYKFEFRCKHGTVYVGEIDASTGEYRISEKS